jgi:hypothetical protein
MWGVAAGVLVATAACDGGNKGTDNFQLQA